MMNKFDKKENNKFQESMYRLLFAPMHDYLVKEQSDIEKILNDKFFVYSIYLRMYANNNRTITAISKDYRNAIKEYLPDNFDLSNVKSLNYLFQKNSIGGVINSIELLLLKKETIQKLLVFELNEATSLKKLINLLIEENTNYSIEFSKYFYRYGSVRDLISFLETSCEDFLQTKLMSERREKIEKVITLKKERNNANFAILGPVLTIILTLFLSFPTLDGILMKINKGSWLLPLYFILNALFISFFAYITREQLRGLWKEIKERLLPSAKEHYLAFAVKAYLKYDDLAIFLNYEYKYAIKLIVNEINNFIFRHRKRF